MTGHMPSRQSGYATIDPGTTLGLVNQVERGRAYRPGYAGHLQHSNIAGWHVLGHGGRIAGEVLAEYHLVSQITTQAGGNQRLLNVYHINYMSV